MQRYEDYRSNVPSRKDDRLSENSGVTNEKRTPIRPRESMKDIIYNGVGVGDEGNQKAGSRVRLEICSNRETPPMPITPLPARIEDG